MSENINNGVSMAAWPGNISNNQLSSSKIFNESWLLRLAWHQCRLVIRKRNRSILAWRWLQIENAAAGENGVNRNGWLAG
jgi:hypothetical protein